MVARKVIDNHTLVKLTHLADMAITSTRPLLARYREIVVWNRHEKAQVSEPLI